MNPRSFTQRSLLIRPAVILLVSVSCGGRGPLVKVSDLSTAINSSIAAELGILALPEAEDARIGKVSVGRLKAEGFTKAAAVEAPNSKPIWIVAQTQVPNIAVARARNLLRFFLQPVEGSEWGGIEIKAAVANTMAERHAMLMMPTGAHREGHEPRIPAQPLYQDETPIEGSTWYLNNDWDHRDAAFEEIFHLVHDMGIGTDRPGALPAYQEMIDSEARRAIADQRWGRPINDRVDRWLKELEAENSLAQEYIAAVIDTYYGLWGAFDRRAGGMWGIYVAKTRNELAELDPRGRELVEMFLPPTLEGYEALVDPSFEGTFTLRFDPERPWTHKSRYLVEVRLTGSRSSSVEGNQEDNVLTGNRGDNLLDGGEGRDTACFKGPRSDYLLRMDGQRLEVRDTEPDRDGTDTLVEIEVLRFADGTLSVDALE